MTDPTVQTAPEAPAADKPAKAKKQPITTKYFRNPDSGTSMKLVHDPNTGVYVETLTDIEGRKSETKHTAFSHAWARFKEVEAPPAAKG